MRIISKSNGQGVLLLSSLMITGPVLAGVEAANHPLAPSSVEKTANFLSKFKLSSLNIKKGHVSLQLGGNWTSIGNSQHVNLLGTYYGGDYSVNSNDKFNGLVGLSYLMDGDHYEHFNMAYGLNFFYLPKVNVSGDLTVENYFTNISYVYNVTQYPLYVMAKSTIDLKSPTYALTLDAGIGPNFMRVAGYNETPIPGGYTAPQNTFSSNTTTTFSATIGLGMKVKQFFGQAPLECGYRFFYLGQGHLNVIDNQASTGLNTGQAYANAVMCSITV